MIQFFKDERDDLCYCLDFVQIEQTIKATQQFDFTENLDWAENTKVFLCLKDVKRIISQETERVLWFFSTSTSRFLIKFNINIEWLSITV